ncbi:hypothetical protein [Comamonas kerstersii]|uniref:hypothetical protein n=1 Tax=Comamonas kerstersii TaxID=225992 RepID=UPI001B339048|nr:hypothetical protein [Comamonas kerstersii]QTW20240.1 hypothetical protein H8N02_07435 [Comamonas kerstersii]
MLIKFKDTDPRAGQIVRMDSSRGQQLIDAGAAEQVAESGAPVQAKAAPAAAARPAAQQSSDAGAAEQVAEAAKPKSAKGKK